MHPASPAVRRRSASSRNVGPTSTFNRSSHDEPRRPVRGIARGTASTTTPRTSTACRTSRGRRGRSPGRTCRRRPCSSVSPSSSSQSSIRPTLSSIDGDHPEVVLDVALVAPPDLFVLGQSRRHRSLQVDDRIEIHQVHLHRPHYVGAAGVVVEHGVGFGNVDVVVHREVFAARLPRAVRCLVVTEQHERPVRIALDRANRDNRR